MDPKIAEVLRARELSHTSLFWFQKYLRNVIQPKLDRLDAIDAATAAAETQKRPAKAPVTA